MMLPLSGCMTQPQPCTPEWVEWKTDRVLERYARSNADTMRALRDASEDFESGGAIMAVRMATLADDFLALARDFDRIILPELNDAVRQCSEPRNFVPAFSEYLRREGVDDDIIGWVELLGYVAIDRSY
jgi:hypothetical protein